MDDVNFNKQMLKLMEKRDRDKEIIRLRKDGWTLQKIADKYGLTKARVQQIAKGVTNHG